MGFLRHSVLALRVLVWVLVASLAVFALASALGFAYEREKALQLAQAQAHDTAQRSLSAVSNALWQCDVAALNALLAGLVASPVVVRAEVLALDKPIADVRQIGFAGEVDRVWTLPIMARDQTTPIGSLRISESYAPTRAHVFETLGILVATDLIKVVGLAPGAVHDCLPQGRAALAPAGEGCQRFGACSRRTQADPDLKATHHPPRRDRHSGGCDQRFCHRAQGLGGSAAHRRLRLRVPAGHGHYRCAAGHPAGQPGVYPDHRLQR
ncbi:MAG: hypothetical protein IPO43_06630 [Rhodoferax sp.]|nr:hypothetical protein [Rhodoferax sp.]